MKSTTSFFSNNIRLFSFSPQLLDLGLLDQLVRLVASVAKSQ